MLECERNDPEVCVAILGAAAAFLDLPEWELQADYEHGQWWVTHLPTGAQWSACDAETRDVVCGFIFEQVTIG